MRRFLIVVGTAVCALAALQCASEKKTNTPSSLSAIYGENSIAALRGTREIRVDRIARGEHADDEDFVLDEYRLVKSGRVLSSEEATRLRQLLLDPNSYTTMPYLCVFEPQVAFTLTGDDSSCYFVLANDCHLAALQTVHSREDVTLTEKSATILGAFTEALFQ